MAVAAVNDVVMGLSEVGSVLEHLQVLAVGTADQASIVVAVKKRRVGASATTFDLKATVEGSNDLGRWTALPNGPHVSFDLLLPSPAVDKRTQLGVGGYRYLRVRYELHLDSFVPEESGSVLFSSTLALVPKE